MVEVRSVCNVLVELIVIFLRIIYYYAEALYKFVVPPSPKDIRGKVVVVTGAGGGIGRTLSTRLAASGARIAVWDINTEGADETVDIIRSKGGVSHSYQCDVTKPDDVRKAAQQVRTQMGDVEMLVNNAGCCACRNLLELSESEIRRTFDVNTIAHFWMVKEFLPAMIKRNSGHIVTIASMSARGGHPMLTDYCASKYAVFGFTEALDEELRADGMAGDGLTGIHLTTVCPMFVDTNMLQKMSHRCELTGRFGVGLMTSEYAAESAVTGILRNNRYVYIPGFGSLAGLKEFMPRKVEHCLNDFFNLGFRATDKDK